MLAGMQNDSKHSDASKAVVVLAQVGHSLGLVVGQRAVHPTACRS